VKSSRAARGYLPKVPIVVAVCLSTAYDPGVTLDWPLEEAHLVGAWRSLVARLLWEQEVAGPNPAAPTSTIDTVTAPRGGQESHPMTEAERMSSPGPATRGVAIAPTPAGYRAAKRALDVAASGIGLVVTSPLLLAIAVAVRLESAGPILFRQQRIGLGGRSFVLYKFRSMHEAADEAAHREYVERLLAPRGPAPDPSAWVPIAGDPRVTRVGGFLRRSHLDEMPQLLNILKGDMSLVGPRPPIPYEVELYEPWQLERLAVTPGLTGLWQANGWGRLSFEQGVRLDLEYVRRRTFWLDVRIVLRTLWQIVTGRQF
jgi:lipopolysaccharide/colanic/teichoic acid biosynthesis glycosyltransferase